MTSIACELKEEFANKQTEIPCIIVGCIKMADFKTLRIRNWAIVCLAKCVSLVEVFLSLIETPKYVRIIQVIGSFELEFLVIFPS